MKISRKILVELGISIIFLPYSCELTLWNAVSHTLLV